MPAVTEQINEYVLSEFLTVIQRDLHSEGHGLHIICVHMEDGALGDLGHIGAIGAGAPVDVVGGEANLVVGDDVDRTAGGVGLEA